MSVVPAYLGLFLAIAFMAAGAVHLIGVPLIARAYQRWDYPAGFRRVTGTLLLLAGALMAFAPTRLFGAAIATLVMFLSAITLLNHRQYGIAAPIIALLFALVPMALASQA
ncbi:MAG: DoxX family protein [Alphaproteobacteria bacterium]|nr:DoxX family protein [Alphaproteobacteria bacterium]MBV9418997.1 DoxX family protein [Alphaproteobacteria bacterium]MBV9904814.1 DoxX family protein [Alphaproteobacteria bacterium]